MLHTGMFLSHELHIFAQTLQNTIWVMIFLDLSFLL